jgi:uncharacterized membrane protein YbhN (UPF0104 family)
MRRLALIAAKATVSATLLYFAVARLNFAAVEQRLARLDLGWLAAAFAVGLLQTALVAIRWRRIAQVCGAMMPPAQAIRFTFIAAFFNQVLPSTVGGDAVRIWLLARNGSGWTAAAYSVLLDRFIGVMMLALAVAGGLFWSLRLIEHPIGRGMLLAVGLGSLAAGAAFLGLGHWRRLAAFKLTAHLLRLAVLAREVLFSARVAPAVVALSLLVHGLTAAIAWMLARAVAAPFDFGLAVLLVLPVMLIATVPISIAGWGVRETALVVAFSYAGLADSDGLIVSVMLGLVMIAVGVVGGVVWLAGGERLRLRGAATTETDGPRGESG